MSHALDLDIVPPPHVAEQALNGVHGPYPPSTDTATGCNVVLTAGEVAQFYKDQFKVFTMLTVFTIDSAKRQHLKLVAFRPDTFRLRSNEFRQSCKGLNNPSK